MLKETKSVWDDHITMSPENARVTVKVNGVRLASSTNAILLCEGDRDPVYYIPSADVNHKNLVDSTFLAYCKWKGEASYMTYKSEALTVEDILWKYKHAHTPVAEIRDCVSFDVEKVMITVSDA